MPARKTNEQFVDELKLKNPNVLFLGTYMRNNQKGECCCKLCGHHWMATPANLLSGTGCPTCGIKKRAKTQSKSTSEFIEELSVISPNIEVVGEYNGARNYIDVKCRNCGNMWHALPTNLLKGRGCPTCSRKAGTDKVRRSDSDFKKFLMEEHATIESLEPYAGRQKKMSFKCKACGYTWKTSPASIMNGHGCPRCAGNERYSASGFQKKLGGINPRVIIIGEYLNNHIPVLCKCSICNHEWKARPHNLLMGKGCPKCFHSSTSYVEEAIYEALICALGEEEVIARDRKTIGRELDIFLPQYHVAIEPGSWKWHEKKYENDLQKRKTCADKGIRLITIYTDYPSEVAPFDSDCFACAETIGYEKDFGLLKKIVYWIFDICGIQYQLSEKEWHTVSDTAYLNSRRITTEEYINRVHEINKKVSVIGEYTGSWNRIKVKCLRCGHEWSPIANSLVRGSGCPKCASMEKGERLRKDHQQFIRELRSISPLIEIKSKYVRNGDKVLCKCLKCGHQWAATPGNLLKGKGCPSCVREKNARDRSKSPSDFILELNAKNPNVEVIETYVNSHKEIQCRCKKCGNEWKAMPINLLKGRGCPLCGIKTAAIKKYKKVIKVETGEIYESIKEAASSVGTSESNITAAVTGKSKSAKGFHWSYFDE